MDQATLFANLETLTGLSAAAWSDVISCTEDEQALILEGFAGQDWVVQTSKLAPVLALLTAAASVAGAVAGIGTAINVLRSL